MSSYYGYEGEPITQMKWLLMFESPERLLAQENIGLYFISTVWLGLDHGFGHSEQPLIFETMVFRDGKEVEMARHATREEALGWHARWREQIVALQAVEG